MSKIVRSFRGRHTRDFLGIPRGKEYGYDVLEDGTVLRLDRTKFFPIDVDVLETWANDPNDPLNEIEVN